MNAKRAKSVRDISVMRTLLVILSYAKANDMVERHWPYFLKADCDIMGVGREGSGCRFPQERLVWTAFYGKDEYVNGSNLPDYHIRAMSCALSLTHGEDQPYTHFILTEPDAITLKPLPLHIGGLMATYCGGKSHGFLGNAFFHGPWYVDRPTAYRFVDGGKAMLHCGLIEQGFPDRFWGLWQELNCVKFTPLNPSHSYSQNRLDRPQYIQEAREAIARGCCYIHGLKLESELQAVTEGLV